jgi:hypothetical protein
VNIKETLAGWIEAGLRHPRFTEDKGCFINKPDFPEHPFMGCALMACLVGKVGSPEEAHRLFCNRSGNPISRIKYLCEIPHNLAWEINELHTNGVSATVIATKLRTRARYEGLADAMIKHGLAETKKRELVPA